MLVQHEISGFLAHLAYMPMNLCNYDLSVIVVIIAIAVVVVIIVVVIIIIGVVCLQLSQ